jgi:hypothetical protein
MSSIDSVDHGFKDYLVYFNKNRNEYKIFHDDYDQALNASRKLIQDSEVTSISIFKTSYKDGKLNENYCTSILYIHKSEDGTIRQSF